MTTTVTADGSAKEDRDGPPVADGHEGLRDDSTVTQISAAAAALGRKGGQSTSAAKAAAARTNGRKGGRPRKVPANA